LSSNDFSDLQNFGKTINNKSKYETKNVKKNKNKKDFSEIYFLKLKLFIKQIVKLVVYIIKLSIKKVTISIRKTKKNKTTKPIVKPKKQIKNIEENIGFKIIEKKRQRRNKTIITRKRVPINYKLKKSQMREINLCALYYLSIKDDETGIQEIDKEKYCSIKKSVWDFPIDDNNLMKNLFYFKHRK
jgi:hypothetical protein